MRTTLNKIRAHSPCADGWSKLLKNLGKNKADDAALSIATILASNGVEDAIWCLRAVEGHEKQIRLYAVWCARQVQHLMKDKRSIAALDVAERYATNEATIDELAIARVAARVAARDAESDAVWSATSAAARSAAWAAVWSASRSATSDAVWDAVWAAAWSAAWAAVWSAKSDAARDAVWDAPEQQLRRVLSEIEATNNKENA